MDWLMNVLDRFTHPTRGLVLSGVNPSLDALCDDEIRKLIGRHVKIQHRDGTERTASVEAVDVARSLLGKVNIHIALGSNFGESDVELGATVLALHEDDGRGA